MNLMGLSEFLSILDIVVTVLIGFVITHMVSVRDSRTRAIKDYYIQELSAIKVEINVFYSKIFKGELAAKDIICWYKILKNKVDCIEKSVKKTFSIYDPSIAETLFSNFKHISSTEDFNNNFDKDKVGFNGVTIKEFGCELRELSETIEQTLYDINNSSSQDYLHRKRLEFKSHFKYYRAEKKSVVNACFTVLFDWLKTHITRLLIIVVLLSLVYWGFNYLAGLAANNQTEAVCEEMPKWNESQLAFEEDTLVIEGDTIIAAEDCFEQAVSNNDSIAL